MDCAAAADLIICRAGAMSLSELEVQAKPAILIPSPNVAENHQYYNALAKENKTISTTRDMDYELKRDYLEKSNYYYSRKDRATLTALRMLDFRGVVAYFVKVRSRFLKGKLFEIVIEEENIILHSTSPLILNCLREEGVFQEESRKSLIDEYVNHRY